MGSSREWIFAGYTSAAPRSRSPYRLVVFVAVLVVVVLALIAWLVLPAVRLLRGPRVISAGFGPDALALSPDGGTLYVADYGQSTWNGVEGRTVTPVSLPAGRPAPAIVVGRQPVQMVPMANGELYVLIETDSSAAVIPVSVATGKAGPAMTVPGGAGYLLASPDRRTLYVACGTSGQEIVPVDVATGHRGLPVKLAAGFVTAVVSADGATLYAAYADAGDQPGGEIVPVSLRTGRAGQPVRLGDSPIGMAPSPDGKSLYVAASIGYGPGEPLGPQDLFVVSVASRRVVRSVTLRNQPQAIAVAPNGRTIYIQNADTTITPVSTTTWAAGATIHTSGLISGQGAGLPGMGYLSSLVITQDGRTMYASNGVGVAVIPLAG